MPTDVLTVAVTVTWFQNVGIGPGGAIAVNGRLEHSVEDSADSQPRVNSNRVGLRLA